MANLYLIKMQIESRHCKEPGWLWEGKMNARWVGGRDCERHPSCRKATWGPNTVPDSPFTYEEPGPWALPHSGLGSHWEPASPAPGPRSQARPPLPTRMAPRVPRLVPGLSVSLAGG